MDGFVEGGEPLAVVRLADHERQGDLGGIEGVERLAGFVEDEVGDIDDVVYRAQSDGSEALFQPSGGLAHHDIVDSGGCIEGAGFRCFEFDEIGWGCCGRRYGTFRGEERGLEQGREFAGHAGVG